METLLPESKFLEAFRSVAKHEGHVLVGDVLLVEQVDPGEPRTASGLVLPGKTDRVDGLEMNKPMLCRVLQVGNGYFDEENPDVTVPLEVEVGDVILVGRMSVSWFSVFGNLISEAGKQIGIVRENEIRMRWKGKEGYEGYFRAIAESLACRK